MAKVVLGFAPTRRSIFSAPDAIKYANLTRERLKELGVEFVDIDDINEEGLLYDDNDRIKVAAKFKAAGVNGLFLPHGNFGTEYVVARLAKELNVPVLLWGPRDERPEIRAGHKGFPGGMQCGQGLQEHPYPADRTSSLRFLVHHVQRGRTSGEV